MRNRLKEFGSSVGLIVLVAFLVRLFVMELFYHSYGELARTNIPLGVYGEAGSIAKAIAEGRGFSSPLHKFQTGPTVWLTPVFPYLLAAIFKLFGTYSYLSGLLINTLNIVFSAFTCWPICEIGTRAFGKTTGKISAWAWAFCPTAIYFPVMWVWDTSLAAMWMAILFAATLALRGSTRSSWLGYGALWAVGALINPSVLSVLPFLALWAIWPLRQNFAHAARLAAMAAVIFAAGIAPWGIRNYVVFHKFIPLRSNFGLELWLGNNSNIVDNTWAETYHPNENDVEGAKYARMTEIPYMEEKQHEAVAFIRTHPLDTLHSMFRRFTETWLGIWDAPADVWGPAPLYVKVILAWTFGFSLFALLGVLFAYRAGKEEAFPFGMMMLVFPFIFYLTHPSLRYRFPLDPIMQVLSVYAFAYPLSKLLSRWQRLPQPAAQASAD